MRTVINDLASGAFAAVVKMLNKVTAYLSQPPRVKEYVIVPAQAAALATTAYPVFVAHDDLSHLSIAIIPSAAVTGDTTNYRNLNIQLDGVEIGNYDLDAATNNLIADTPYYFTLSTRTVPKGSVLSVVSEKVASGVLVPNFTVEVSYIPSKPMPVHTNRVLAVIPPTAAADVTIAFPVFASPVTLASLSASIVPGAAVTGAATHYKTIAIKQLDTDGLNSVTLGSYALSLGNDLVALTRKGISIAHASMLVAERPVLLEVTKVSNGLVTPAMLLILDYVPATAFVEGQRYIFATIPAVTAALATQTDTIAILPGPASALSVDAWPESAITGADTHTKHLNLLGGSAGSTELANLDLTSGNDMPVMDAYPFVLTGMEKITGADRLRFQTEKIGNGQALPSFLLRIGLRDAFTQALPPTTIEGIRLSPAPKD